MGAKRDRSPRGPNHPLPARQDTVLSGPEAKVDAPAAAAKPDPAANAELARPLAPPPRPLQPQAQLQGQPAAGAAAPSGTQTPDYFADQVGAGGAAGGGAGSLSLEPNPFEQSFGAPPAETPGGTKLPPVAALTSPSSLLPGTGVTPYPWGSSLRTGPLSPAMLSGPTTDYFSDTHHLARGFPTPNESNLRTGLTPGGSGSMFPAPSPNTQALFAQLGAAATPGALEFQRTALNAAAATKRDPQNHVLSAETAAAPQAHEGPNGIAVPATNGKPDPDKDAANGLYMLANGRNGAAQPPPPSHYPAPPPPPAQVHPPPPAPVHASQPPKNVSPRMNGNASTAGSSVRGVSEAASAASEESNPQPVTRGKGKRNSTAAPPAVNGRRKAEELPAKAPASKKAKSNGGASFVEDVDMDHSDDEKTNPDGTKSKMTDEEKRKNFLERNRVAALKCRQRKKQWLANLQTKVELYSQENDSLTAQVAQLREEVVSLKALLLAHKDCNVTQQQGLQGAFMQQQALEPFGGQMHAYAMGAPLPNQPVMPPHPPPHPPSDRRFS